MVPYFVMSLVAPSAHAGMFKSPHFSKTWEVALNSIPTRPVPLLQEINVEIKDTIQTWAMVISPTVPTITIISETIISEVPAIIALPVVSHPLPVTDPEVVHPLGTAPGVVPPLGTAPGAQHHSVEVRPLVIAPEPEMGITHQEISPHWEIF